MTTLDPKDGYAVLINTFTVRPERVEALMESLAQATETMKRMSGFVSANLHVSEDRKRVANYAQWRSKSDFQAMLENVDAQPHMKAAADLAESFEPILYELKYSGN